MTAPTFAATDADTASLLDLLADDGTYSAEHEWVEFVRCLHHAADAEGIVRPNSLRPLVRGVVKPNRIGAFVRRAVTSGLMAPTGDWQASDDVTSRNSGKPSRCYRLT